MELKNGEPGRRGGDETVNGKENHEKKT